MYRYLLVLLAAIALTSCGEYQRVLKSNDADYRLDFAKRYSQNLLPFPLEYE